MKSLFKKILGGIDKGVEKLLYTPIHPLSPQEKIGVLREYARKYPATVFVETGTFEGGTVHALKDQFKKLVSIELMPELAAQAKQRFAGDAHVSIIEGDSGIELKKVVENLDGPALFWLDGHYSGSGTAQADLDSPVFHELGYILDHKVKNHIILIDDARFFFGANGYPTMKNLSTFIMSKSKGSMHLEVKDDIVRITPGTHPAVYDNSLKTKLWHFYLRLKSSLKNKTS